MNIVFLLLPVSIVLGLVAGIGYVWASWSGQFDDLDTPPLRALNDDVDERESTDFKG